MHDILFQARAICDDSDVAAQGSRITIELIIYLSWRSLSGINLTAVASELKKKRDILIPGCDGAGLVTAVGSSVKDFRPGDRVVTHLAPKLVEASGDDAPSTIADISATLGSGNAGTLRSHTVFLEGALVPAPKSLDWLRASSLTYTWTTAWNALYRLKDKRIGPGSWVLIQGTGGVSVAILELAVAAGANVVGTTSTEDRVARLAEPGATHTINYRTKPESWGAEARAQTPGGRGFDIGYQCGR
ncbi:hypothetical protein NUW58_g4029 [Xylaria curta]|uniref:Uncharacterized protein n=1 Tax=Xylaria curta TaxID=42375 RepID=A0ACC1PAZ0_9PEZI|nr:hypothetical protein NUW58_g4029 [Xylaria curta]